MTTRPDARDRDPLFDEWIEAALRELGWTLGIPPDTLIRGLHDGSFADSWRAARPLLPRISQARADLWAASLLTAALAQLERTGRFGCVRWNARCNSSVLHAPGSFADLAHLDADQLASMSLGIHDTALGRVVKCHALLAKGRPELADRALRLWARQARTSDELKCLLQARGLSQLAQGRKHDARKQYEHADALAAEWSFDAEDQATSKFNLSLLALERGDDEAYRRTFGRLLRTSRLPERYLRELGARTLRSDASSVTLDEHAVSMLAAGLPGWAWPANHSSLDVHLSADLPQAE